MVSVAEGKPQMAKTGADTAPGIGVDTAAGIVVDTSAGIVVDTAASIVVANTGSPGALPLVVGPRMLVAETTMTLVGRRDGPLRGSDGLASDHPALNRPS